MRRTQRPPAMIAVLGILAAQTNAPVFAVSVAKAVNAMHVVSDTDGIRTPAGRAQWIPSPSP